MKTTNIVNVKTLVDLVDRTGKTNFFIPKGTPGVMNTETNFAIFEEEYAAPVAVTPKEVKKTR